MTASPRSLPLHAPRRWALSVLAWLMLVLSNAQAVPTVAMVHAASALASATAMAVPAPARAEFGPPHAAGHGTAQHGSPAPIAHAAADGCCAPADGSAHATATFSCHCPTMCAPALLPLPGLAMAARLPLAMIVPAAVPGAPYRPASPPLRPPQA
ncbi:hypothetical protein [Dyella sp.]|jgi:hypothetical protein|uniref:hypothetical protein n=1 Tax=Dyella sp. TaxID=1869338 RepID=UPI002D77E992|nr:hypothetical protein [Dyella sp.]HET6434035.1 hypothetical protein [Dyella sp.]